MCGPCIVTWMCLVMSSARVAKTASPGDVLSAITFEAVGRTVLMLSAYA